MRPGDRRDVPIIVDLRYVDGVATSHDVCRTGSRGQTLPASPTPDVAMRIVIALLLFVCFAPRPIVAQETPSSLAVGTSVRISAPSLGDEPRPASIVASTPDTLVVRPTGARDFTVTIARADITRIEVVTGHRPRKGRFALVGLVAGTVVGGIGGAMAYSDPCVKEPAICAGWFHETRQADAIEGALAGAMLGALGGAMLGQIWQREVWTALPLTRTVRRHVAPELGGVAPRERAAVTGVRIALRWRE
jgi:hypothetical protein